MSALHAFPTAINVDDYTDIPFSHMDGNIAVYRNNELIELEVRICDMTGEGEYIGQISWREDRDDDGIRHFDHDGSEVK